MNEASRPWSAWVILAGTAFFAWLAGRLLGEHGLWASLLFYLPAPVVAFSLLLAAWRQRARRRWCAVLLIAALLPGWTVWREQRWQAPPAATPSAGPSLRVVHWNVCRGYAGWPRIAGVLADSGADLLILSEVQTQSDAAILHKLLPDFPSFRYLPPIALFSRVRLGRMERIAGGHGLRVFQGTFDPEGQPWRFFAVDLISNPFAPREPLLETLRDLVEARHPDFIAGDFNTPRDSRWLQPLAPGWQHAYALRGQGWSYTWPLPAPFLALDHLLVPKRTLAVDEYLLESHPWSDHRLQRAVLRRLAAQPSADS